MGQRLNIEIKNNEKVLANCYYHWSGYTSSSLELTKQIIDFIDENKVTPDVEGAIKCLVVTGGTFNEQAWDAANNMGIVFGEMPECTGRNAGLIAVDEKNMDETRSWEEGRIEINIENKTFDFNCAWQKDFMNYDDIWDKISDLFFKVEGIESKWDIPFDKIDVLLTGVKESEKNYSGRFYFEGSCFFSIY